MHQEVVETEGHLIDSHVMERIFDTVVEFNGRFEVEQFRIGKTNAELSYLRMKVETPQASDMQQMMSRLVGLGCTPVDTGDAVLVTIDRDRCAPEDFYSTTNHKTLVRHKAEWVEVQNQRMDALIVVNDNGAFCRRLRDIKKGDRVVSGMRGIRVVPESKERDRLAFAFMSNGISSERQVETAVRQTAALMQQARDAGLKIVVVAGPVVVHTGGARPLSALIQAGWVQALLAGNALGVHDIEASLLGTSLGVRQSDGRQEEHGHRNHMRAINAIYHAGSIAQAVETGKLSSGVMYQCVKAGVPFVLAGSLRDDGPLPDTITDMNLAQDAYAEQLKGAGLVLCLGSMLHSIATGNMLPSWVKIVCVDINPAVATKVSDRGTGQAVGVVTDVGLFLEMLSRELNAVPASHAPVLGGAAPVPPASALDNAASVLPVPALGGAALVPPASALDDAASVLPAPALDNAASVLPVPALGGAALVPPASALDDAASVLPAPALGDAALVLPASALDDAASVLPAPALGGAALVPPVPAQDYPARTPPVRAGIPDSAAARTPPVTAGIPPSEK